MLVCVCQYFTTASVFPPLYISISTSVSISSTASVCVSGCAVPPFQYFLNCVSVFPPLCQYVCVCHSVSALVPLCQYFHNCVSVFPPVSVFPARCECFQHCQCQYCVSMSMQWCIQSVYYVMQCSKAPFTHTLRRGGYRACVCGQRVGAHYSRAQALSHTDPHSGREGPSPTTGARTHHRDVSQAPAETPTPRLASLPQAQDFTTFHHNVGWLGWFGLISWVDRLLAWFGLASWVGRLLGWFGLASLVDRLTWLVWPCFVGW